MHQELKISIIIPVYNAGKHLKRCLESVINQSYKNLEIICSNDASTDNSIEILEEYANKDVRIIILNNENNIKAGKSRNRGLEIATGSYVHFLDSDDWIEENTYLKLINIINTTQNVDIISFRWNYFNQKNSKFTPYEYKNKEFVNKVCNIYETPEVIENWVRTPWCKIYSRNFLINNKISYNNLPFSEDMEHGVKTLLATNKIYFYDEILINYTINNPKSLVANSHKNIDCVIESYFKNEAHCKGIDEKVRTYILCAELNTLLYNLKMGVYRDTITLQKAREISQKVDFSLYSKVYRKHVCYMNYNYLLLTPLFILKLTQAIQHFLKYNLKSIYLRLEKILQGIINL